MFLRQKMPKRGLFNAIFKKRYDSFTIFLTYKNVSFNLSLHQHVFCKKEMMQKQKTQFIGYLDCYKYFLSPVKRTIVSE